MNRPIEIEAKYEVDEAGRKALAAVERVGGFTVVKRAGATQSDTYFDTADGKLTDADATLRIRRGAKGILMTFKGPRSEPDAGEQHIFSRQELEAHLPHEVDADVETLPAMPGFAPWEAAHDLVGNAAMMPTAIIENNRLSIELEDDCGSTLELDIDDCRGLRLADGRRVSWQEVELEAVGSDRELLLKTAERLREIAPSMRPSHATKLGRVLD